MSNALWSSLDSRNQVALGVLANFELENRPLYITTGLQVSGDVGAVGGSTNAVTDLSVGLKLMKTLRAFCPYIRAGIASVGASIETDSSGNDDDQPFGYDIGYDISGGALFRIGGHFVLGVDLRYLGGTDIDLFALTGDADSVTATALIGYSRGN